MSYGDVTPEEQAEIDRLVELHHSINNHEITSRARPLFLQLRGYVGALEASERVSPDQIQRLRAAVETIADTLLEIRNAETRTTD